MSNKYDFDRALRGLADGFIQNNEREGPYGFNQNARRVLTAIFDDAATRMRDKCVDELNGLLAEYEEEQRERTKDEGSAHRIVRAATLAMQRAIARVQSLTLDQEQEKPNV